MTKTEQLAEKYAKDESKLGGDFLDCKISFEYGSYSMLARVLDFMRTFQNSSGEFPLYDYIGNIRKAMEE